MQRLILTVLAMAICLPVSTFCQNQHASSDYRLVGRFIDQDSAVIPGLFLDIRKDGKSFGGYTDVNGNFDIGVSAGDYEITAPEIPAAAFRAFVKITEQGPNPQNIEFIVDSGSLCSAGLNGLAYPAVSKSASPRVTDAARAVRALGKVIVELSVDVSGRVTSARAVSGHPLLRSGSEVAAKQFEFEPADKPAMRLARITFIYIDGGMNPKDIRRFDCAYRILVMHPANTIETSINRSGHPAQPAFP